MDSVSKNHLFVYVTTFFMSYIYSLQYNSILSSFIVGWSMYGMSTIGHDLLHLPTKYNKRIAFFCMDMILFNSDDWIQIHNKNHHCDLKGDNDIMRLKGDNLLTEWYHLLEISKNSTILQHLYRIPLYYLLYQLKLYQILCIYFSVFFCLAYFTYITHSDSVISQYTRGSIQHNLDNTWDIFPDSWFCTLLFGGINVHATHHCYPTLSRGLLKDKSHYLSKKYPDNYRSITTLKQFYRLLKDRHIN